MSCERQAYKFSLTDNTFGGKMSVVYVFEGSVIKISRERYVVYPPKEYQEKLRKLHGERVKVIVVKESD
jgi:hypothetical protein